MAYPLPVLIPFNLSNIFIIYRRLTDFNSKIFMVSGTDFPLLDQIPTDYALALHVQVEFPVDLAKLDYHRLKT